MRPILARFRYWKLNSDDLEKMNYEEENLVNWEIKCTFQPDDDAKFFGVFLYRYGTPHDYETKKGIVFYHNNIDRNEIPNVTKFLKKRYGGNEIENLREYFLMVQLNYTRQQTSQNFQRKLKPSLALIT